MLVKDSGIWPIIVEMWKKEKEEAEMEKWVEECRRRNEKEREEEDR